MTDFKSPFANDPFSMVYAAFKKLYPDKDCTCYWEPKSNWEPDNEADSQGTGEMTFGETQWSDDGQVTVLVAGDIAVYNAVEILAHELAHVAVGKDAEHGPEWETAFEAIFSEYNRMGEKLFGSAVKETEAESD